jgi:RimJ/RimL family protein N-acetyltransferase
MILKGKIVTLRPIEEEDLEFVRTLFNDPELESLVVGWSWPVSKYQHRKWFEKVSADTNSIRYIIETKEDGPVGTSGWRPIDWKNRIAASIGIRIINKQLRSKGIGIDTSMAMFKYIFDELQLNRTDSEVIEYNKASIKLLEKLGYKLEGVRRNYIYKNGKYNNLLLYGLLREEYYEAVKRLKYWEHEEK